MNAWRRKYTGRYYNVKTVYDGIEFDSKAEVIRYQELMLMFKAGQITKPEYHPVYDINVGGQRICRYEADFRYSKITEAATHDGYVIEDVKCRHKTKHGAVRTTMTADARIKHKLVNAIYGVPVTIIWDER